MNEDNAEKLYAGFPKRQDEQSISALAAPSKDNT